MKVGFQKKCVFASVLQFGMLVFIALGFAVESAYAQQDVLQCQSGDTYFPRGDHFALAPNEAIEYRISTVGSDDISNTAETDAIRRLFPEWTETTCLGGDMPNLRITEGAAYAQADTGDDTDTNSYQNIIFWKESGWAATNQSSQTLAITNSLFTTYTQVIVNADIIFNGVNYQWRARANGASTYSGCSGGDSCFDVETVGLHEAGHFFGFNHVSCVDAVMFPSGTAAQSRVELSNHEEAGVCTLYLPRPVTVSCDAGSDCRTFGEACSADNQCDTGNCVIDPQATIFPGFCSNSCQDEEDCPFAYDCRTNVAGTFCAPGPHFDGSEETTGGGCECDVTPSCESACSCDPNCQQGPTGGAVEPPDDNEEVEGGVAGLCDPCLDASDCAGGMCILDPDGIQEFGTCTQGCLPNTGGACPDDFSCIAIDNSSIFVCWPDDYEETCGGHQAAGGGLNDLCFVENTADVTDSWFNPCGVDLVCFGFKASCNGQRGECVSYCSQDVACAPGLSCCEGVDAAGNCLSLSTSEVGGCFDIRVSGQSCFEAENSVCGEGLGCFQTEEGVVPDCFETCDDGVCAEGSSCFQFATTCGAAAVCCSNDGSDCEPLVVDHKKEIGVACSKNADCDSGICQIISGEGACTRPCNPATGIGCPTDGTDVNGDGIQDGRFSCLALDDAGVCWPDDGPIRAHQSEPPPDDGGCCNNNASGMSAQAFFSNVLPWLALILASRRRRHLPIKN